MRIVSGWAWYGEGVNGGKVYVLLDKPASVPHDIARALNNMYHALWMLHVHPKYPKKRSWMVDVLNDSFHGKPVFFPVEDAEDGSETDDDAAPGEDADESA